MLSPRLLSSTGRHGQQQQCGEGRQLCACRPAVRVQVCGHEHVPHLYAGKRQRQMGLQGATRAGREGNQVLTENCHSASRSTQQACIMRQVQGVWVGVLPSTSSARSRTDSTSKACTWRLQHRYPNSSSKHAAIDRPSAIMRLPQGHSKCFLKAGPAKLLCCALNCVCGALACPACSQACGALPPMPSSPDNTVVRPRHGVSHCTQPLNTCAGSIVSAISYMFFPAGSGPGCAPDESAVRGLRVAHIVRSGDPSLVLHPLPSAYGKILAPSLLCLLRPLCTG